ncbi:MAG: ferredoxin-NADP reductase [Bacteriovoracaceae bacterium]|jgi:ferredoxin-NADP reductase
MSIYQGLFYLSSGIGIYFILLLSLRIISDSKESRVDSTDDHDNWHNKEELTIVDIIDESRDVKTFRFKRLNEAIFPIFAPGQFLSFQIKEDSKTLRSYSISGSCENTSTLQVSIKLLKDGVGSGWFHSLKIGDTVWAYPPGGLFTDQELENTTPRIYVGGGIGITPLISMVKTAIDRSTKSPMVLFYGMNSVKDLVFHKELLNLSNSYSHFRYFPILSPGAEDWDGETGYISYDYIQSKITIDTAANFYFCGPPIMTDGITEALISNGHEEEKIHGEKFASPAAFDLDKIPKRSVKVEVASSSLAYDGKESLLEFLEDQNIAIPFACRSGVCGECKCKLIEGEVDSFTDSGLTSQEKKSGHILTCVSRPKTNIKIEIV